MKCSQDFIDLFLEFHPEDNFYRSSSSQLYKLEEYSKNKKENNVRVHYTDIRLSKYVDQTILLKYYMEIYWLIESSLNNGYYKTYDNLKYWISNNFDYTIDEKKIKPLTENKETCISNIWKEFDSYKELTKQYNGNIKNKLIKYMKNVMNNIKFDLLTWDNIKIVRDLYNEFESIGKEINYKNVQSFIEKNKKQLYIIQHTIILFMAKFMDLYTLARMFKKTEHKNIVVYTGRTHTMTYLRFLVSIKFEKNI